MFNSTLLVLNNYFCVERFLMTESTSIVQHHEKRGTKISQCGDSVVCVHPNIAMPRPAPPSPPAVTSPHLTGRFTPAGRGTFSGVWSSFMLWWLWSPPVNATGHTVTNILGSDHHAITHCVYCPSAPQAYQLFGPSMRA